MNPDRNRLAAMLNPGLVCGICGHHEDDCTCEWVDDTTTTCPVCEGHGEPMGALGNLTHHRCRQCGIQYTTRNTETS